MPERRSLLPLVLAALASAACLAPAAAEAAKPKLKQPGAVRVEAAGTTTVTVAWKDRSKGERRYEVRAEAPNDSIVVADADANAKRARLKGLERGTPYGISVDGLRQARQLRLTPLHPGGDAAGAVRRPPPGARMRGVSLRG